MWRERLRGVKGRGICSWDVMNERRRKVKRMKRERTDYNISLWNEIRKTFYCLEYCDCNMNQIFVRVIISHMLSTVCLWLTDVLLPNGNVSSSELCYLYVFPSVTFKMEHFEKAHALSVFIITSQDKWTWEVSASLPNRGLYPVKILLLQASLITTVASVLRKNS